MPSPFRKFSAQEAAFAHRRPISRVPDWHSATTEPIATVESTAREISCKRQQQAPPPSTRLQASRTARCSFPRPEASALIRASAPSRKRATAETGPPPAPGPGAGGAASATGAEKRPPQDAMPGAGGSPTACPPPRSPRTSTRGRRPAAQQAQQGRPWRARERGVGERECVCSVARAPGGGGGGCRSVLCCAAPGAEAEARLNCPASDNFR